MSTIMFIAYQKQRGIEYARLMESVRVDGCVKKKSGPNLGRVLDKERGIYQSKERGIFTFDLATNTYGKPPQSYHGWTPRWQKHRLPGPSGPPSRS